MDKLDEQLRRVTERLIRLAHGQTVVGRPITNDQTVAIPLCEVSFGFGGALGGGAGSGKTGPGSGSGAAVSGGLKLRPKAVLVVDRNGPRMVSLEE